MPSPEASGTLYSSRVDAREHIGNGFPRHVAIVPDRNRTWGKEQNPPLNSTESYRIGAKRIIDCAEEAGNLGVAFLSVVLATDDNLEKRDGGEMSGLMDVISDVFLTEGLPKLVADGVKIKLVGRRQLPKEVEQKWGQESVEKYYQVITGFEELQEQSAENTGLTFSIGINYGGDIEITDALAAAREAGVAVKSKEDLKKFSVTSQAGMPDIDWLIRTGGENQQRTNGLWPLHTKNCELDFPNIAWPDFTKEAFKESLQRFGGRKQTRGG